MKYRGQQGAPSMCFWQWQWLQPFHHKRILLCWQFATCMHPLICMIVTLCLPIFTSFSQTSRLCLPQFTSSPPLSSQADDVLYLPPSSYETAFSKKLSQPLLSPSHRIPICRQGDGGEECSVNLHCIIAASLNCDDHVNSLRRPVLPQAFTPIFGQ